jgi:hypothetical protein
MTKNSSTTSVSTVVRTQKQDNPSSIQQLPADLRLQIFFKQQHIKDLACDLQGALTPSQRSRFSELMRAVVDEQSFARESIDGIAKAIADAVRASAFGAD